MGIVAIILGVIVCGAIFVLHCCLRAASDADDYMDCLFKKLD